MQPWTRREKTAGAANLTSSGLQKQPTKLASVGSEGMDGQRTCPTATTIWFGRKVPKAYVGGKTGSSTNWSGKAENACGRMDLGPYFWPCSKNSLNWIGDLNASPNAKISKGKTSRHWQRHWHSESDTRAQNIVGRLFNGVASNLSNSTQPRKRLPEGKKAYSIGDNLCQLFVWLRINIKYI